MTWRIFLFGVLLALAGCAGRGVVKVVPEAANLGQTETLFIGTTRGFDQETAEPFGKVRQYQTRYARLDVSVPPQRRPGEIDWPVKGRA
jgi:esterase/lipase superfamily enzyme